MFFEFRSTLQSRLALNRIVSSSAQSPKGLFATIPDMCAHFYITKSILYNSYSSCLLALQNVKFGEGGLLNG